ncbi:glycosyltransferase [Cupriavidus basilensis]|uniref:Glycosyltransferase n=1 Tax=Cupriavidus basilensis TaxID=68895 RepID=A0ABT6AZP5_9BURK|nr:glycosyltransferase [Cupriavidus basilensis]MDF3838088.1 glycosyltransferase [Cupriavidus basilensis]
MMFDTGFTGRIIQITEALDFGDAVSNQIVALDTMFKGMGLRSEIYSQWHHSNVGHLRKNLDQLEVRDDDVLIIHFAGYSEYVMAQYHEVRCTKICAYHNITPHTFFEHGTDLYSFCLKGREQLRDVVSSFDFFWGDSNYNLQEIIDLGVDPAKCSLVPIIIDRQPVTASSNHSIEPGAWLFLGRVAANKGHIELATLFAQMKAAGSPAAKKLYLVGGFNPNDPYYQKLLNQISKLGISEDVVITGKVPDAEVNDYFRRASIYVSMSQHEGFGVPLIEASLQGLPVLALHNTAIGETLGVKDHLVTSASQLGEAIELVSGDPAARESLLKQQRHNASRYTADAVALNVINALRNVLPESSRYGTVSIVICTYNRADLLDRCLDYLRYQTNQNFEVVVVNGPSDDNTAEVMRKYGDRIKVGSNPTRNLSVSRNIGIELADGDIVAFIDDDALPFDDWVDTLLREFNRRPLTLGAIGGPVYYAGTLDYQAQDIGINKFAEAKVNIDSNQIGKDGWERSLLGTNTCFSASAVRDVLGFDEQFDYFLDESELCYRMQHGNYIVGYCPDLYLRHEFAQSHNRGGKYNFNWFTICKNMAYFIAAYSGLTGKALVEYVNQRMQIERIAPLTAGHKAGEITDADYEKYLVAIRSGVEQGLKDVAGYPRTRMLKAAPQAFKPFTFAAPYPLANEDVPRLHICIVSKEFPPFSGSGGIGTLYYHLASELLLMGHYVTVITPGAEDNVYRRGRFAVRYTVPRAKCSDALGSTGFVNNVSWGVSALSAVAEVHKERSIDVIESALWDSEALPIALLPTGERPPVVVRLVTPFPVAARLNGWQVPQREAELFLAAEATLIKHADAVIPISESIASTIESEYHIQRDHRWHRSHCGIAYWPFFDSSQGYTELKEVNGKAFDIPKTAKIVLFVGRLEGRKGVDTLLAAANEFLATEPSCHLVLAGKDIENWTERAKSILTNEIQARVHLLGSVDDQTREKLLNAAHCVVFPSRYESFGLVPLEAFVHGTPVIASRVGAIPEVVTENKCGLLFEMGNSAMLAECVSRLLKDPTLHASLSRGAHEQIRVFSSRNSAIRAVTLYVSLRNKRAKVSRSETPVLH